MDAILDPAKYKGKSPEVTDGRPINQPGIYRHQDTGVEYITAPGEEGVIQADALMSPIWQNSWQRVGDVPSRVELLAIRKAQELKDKKIEAKEKADEKAEIEAAVK